MKNQKINLFPGEEVVVVVTVSRPNNTTFTQNLYVPLGDSIKDAVAQYQNQLGDPYKWVTIRGKRQRVIKKNAYMIVNYYVQ